MRSLHVSFRRVGIEVGVPVWWNLFAAGLWLVFKLVPEGFAGEIIWLLLMLFRPLS